VLQHLWQLFALKKGSGKTFPIPPVRLARHVTHAADLVVFSNSKDHQTGPYIGILG
jgi:hypothetical protein